MKLVRVGQIVLNLDLVTHVKDPGNGGVMVEFQGGQRLDLITGADALRTWIAANVTAPSPSAGGEIPVSIVPVS